MGSGPVARRCLEEMSFGEARDYFPKGIIADANCLSVDGIPSSTETIELDMYTKKEEEIIKMIELIRPDFLISVQYPWVLSSSILNLMCGRAFNIHNAKLPDYRGHNSLTYEILNEDSLHTSTLHIMSTEVDRGFIVKVAHIDISKDDTALSLWSRSIDSCVFLYRWLVTERNYRFADVVKQPVVGIGRYYGKHQVLKDKEIPPNSDIPTLHRYARAFYFPPHEPAYLLFGKKRIYITPNWSGLDSFSKER